MIFKMNHSILSVKIEVGLLDLTGKKNKYTKKI